MTQREDSSVPTLLTFCPGEANPSDPFPQRQPQGIRQALLTNPQGIQQGNQHTYQTGGDTIREKTAPQLNTEGEGGGERRGRRERERERCVTGHHGKILCIIINSRLVHFLSVNNVLSKCQIGFLPNYHMTDHAFSLHTLIDKHTNQNKRQASCFVDFKKAFDLQILIPSRHRRPRPQTKTIYTSA